MLCSIAAKIEQKDLDQITALEKELGKTILAFQCRTNTKPSKLSEADLKRIKEVEEKLGLTLVAVEF